MAALLWAAAGHSWPPEIDSAEKSGCRARLTATLHTPPANLETHRGVPFDLTGWHTCGMEWTPGSLAVLIRPAPASDNSGPLTTSW